MKTKKQIVGIPDSGINISPINPTVNTGDSVTFTATPINITGPYQWYSSSDQTTWNIISGQTGLTYTFTAGSGDNGLYYKITNGTYTSNFSQLTVNSEATVVITPAPESANDGDSVTFTATPTGITNPTYQWQYSYNGGAFYVNVSGVVSTSDTLTLTVTSAMNGFQYRCSVTDGSTFAITNSNYSILTINDVTVNITTNPLNQTIVEGQSVTFTAAAPLVTWQISYDGGLNFNDYSTDNPLIQTAFAIANGTKYRAKVQNITGGPIYSNVVTLTTP